MKTLFKIHPFFYIFAIICIITGYFKDFIFITFILLFHELGHIITSFYFKWKIDKILLLPFGCITLFDEYINRPIKEEFLIALMGPIFQIILFIIDNNLFRFYNTNLLIFNLIPIFPLDGSKIINIIFNKIFSFKSSHILSIIISIIGIIVLLTFKFNLVFYIALIFLSIKTYKEFKSHKYLFNKFLLERYINNFNFKKTKIVNNYKSLKRDYKHLIKFKNKYLTERAFLIKLFDKS